MGHIELTSEESRARLSALFRYCEIGKCINSVTHDANNILGAIMAYAELIELDGNLDNEGQRMITEVVNGVHKCSQLISNLTAIARQPKNDASVVEIGPFIDKLVSLRIYDIKKSRIALDVQVADNLPSIVIDAPKITVMTLQLISNAMDAVEGTEKPRMRLSVRRQGEGIALGVWNSGPEIPQDIRDLMFEPYFTTKNGTHIGLGLTICQATAHLHSGTLEYQPNEGFVVTLPFKNVLNSGQSCH